MVDGPHETPPPRGEGGAAQPRRVGGPLHRGRARRMRLEPTPAEQRLWNHLRRLKRFGFHFRRQAAMGNYIADFACHSAKLIIELDGSQHGGDYDHRRDAWFALAGYRTVRFWNFQVMEQFAGVVNAINGALAEASPHPTRCAGHLPLEGEG